MTRLAALRHGSLPWLSGFSVAALGLSECLTSVQKVPAVCGSTSLESMAWTIGFVLLTFPVAPLVAGWALMVASMMPPLTSAAVNHVLMSSLPRRKVRSVALFGLSYGATWTLAGVPLLPISVAIVAGLRGAAPAATLLAAVVWSCSPVAQAARNRCHKLSRIGLRGWSADRDCLAQGWTSAIACVASCWPWMLLATTSGRMHVPVMVAVTLMLTMERLLPPTTASWRSPPAISFVRRATAR